MKLERLTDVVGTIESDGEKENMYSISSLILRRISEHEKEYPNAYSYAHEYFGKESAEYAVIKRLGQLEDVQGEFGVDLLKLLTARKVYYMDWDRENGKWRNKEGDLTIREADQERYGFSLSINAKSLELCDLIFGELSTYLDFSDYGKKDKYGGWAFTREELL